MIRAWQSGDYVWVLHPGSIVQDSSSEELGGSLAGYFRGGPRSWSESYALLCPVITASLLCLGPSDWSETVPWVVDSNAPHHGAGSKPCMFLRGGLR